MNVSAQPEVAVSRIGAAIGDLGRSRMLYCLMDGSARTSTELAVVAGVCPSTASAHLATLKNAGLVDVHSQGKHRYYALKGRQVGSALESLLVLTGGTQQQVARPAAPQALRGARTCYDHLAGVLGVALHDRMQSLRWIAPHSTRKVRVYRLTSEGEKALGALGADLDAAQQSRRRFAYACLDWTERRPHLGGALGSAVLKIAVGRKWVVRDLDSRALSITALGRREFLARFDLQI